MTIFLYSTFWYRERVQKLKKNQSVTSITINKMNDLFYVINYSHETHPNMRALWNFSEFIPCTRGIIQFVML